MGDAKKTVLITGGADRIGRAMALAFAGAGYSVALHYRSSEEKALSAMQEIEAMGGECALYRADLREADEVSSLIERVCNVHDLGGLINNASIYVESSLKEGNTALMQEMFDLHFRAPYILTSSFARLQKQGVVINMLDTKISGNTTRHFDYLLSKKLLADYTKMAALQLAPHIRVNAIAPGAILAPPGQDDSYLDARAESIPLQKTGSLKQIANTALYLVENDFITGEIMYVDGGEHLQ